MELSDIRVRDRREENTWLDLGSGKMLVIICQRDEVNALGIRIELRREPSNPAGLAMLETSQAFITSDNLAPAVREPDSPGVEAFGH